MIELEECPFCGSHAIRSQHPGQNWDGKEKNMNIGACYGMWYVGCPHSVFESSFLYDEVKHCEISPAAKWYAKLEDAEREWNKRS